MGEVHQLPFPLPGLDERPSPEEVARIPREDVRLVEALLFASPEPVEERALAARLPDPKGLPVILRLLVATYAGRGINLRKAGTAWAFRTAPDLGPRLGAAAAAPRKLSRAALETLAVIAYHQPATRAEIEEVRGVSLSRGTLDTLLETGWVRLRGRRRTPGRPVTFGTTVAFLDHFGLEQIGDLPDLDELKAAGLLDANVPAHLAAPRAPATAEEDPIEEGTSLGELLTPGGEPPQEE
jgi:segregation and condensation protein B